MTSVPDQQRIRTLIDDHYEMVYRYAYRLSGRRVDAEDIVQQTFMTAHQKLHQLREASAARSWLCSIARNYHLKRVRKAPDETPASLDAVAEPEAESDALDQIDRDELALCLAEVADEFRAAVILFYFQEFSYKEIAEQLDVPLGTVMSRLTRGRKQLCDILLRRNPDYEHFDEPDVKSEATSDTTPNATAARDA